MLHSQEHLSFTARTHPEQAGLLTLAGPIGTAQAAELAAILTTSLANNIGALAVDLSEVTAMGTAAAQVLVAAQKSAQESGHQFCISKWSSEAHQVCLQLGLSPEQLHGLNDYAVAEGGEGH